MIPKVYTPKEVSEILHLPEHEVLQMVATNELASFRIVSGRHLRITEQAVIDLMNGNPQTSDKGTRTQKGGNRVTQSRKRDLTMERRGRDSALRRVEQIAPDLDVHSRKYFNANGKAGIVCVSTTPGGQGYFMGFPGRLLKDPLTPTAIVAVLADREVSFVIPYDHHRSAFEGLSSDHGGGKKFFIKEKHGTHYLVGTGIRQGIPLTKYADRFDWFR